MAYTKTLPNTKDIAWLSKLITSYPATRSEIVRMARRWNFPDTVVEFLRQFPADEAFESRADLVSRCESLALLIRQEWESPHETVQSQQD
jgi:HD-like signal output (HDOD) protein